MRRATILPLAQSDVDEIAAYIAGDHVDAGLRFLSAFGEACSRLLEMPQLGRVFPSPSHRGLEVRCQPVRGFGNWLIFYRPTAEGIEVVRVLHGARDIEALMAADDAADTQWEREREDV